jgi:hypothetical protein
MKDETFNLIDVREEKYEPEEVRRVVLKLRDDTAVPPGEDIRHFLKGWKEIEAEFPGIEIEPLCTSLSPEEIEAHLAYAKEMDAEYAAVAPNFLNYFGVTYPPGTQAEALARALMAAGEVVEYAVPAGFVPPPPLVNDANDGWRPSQTYLNPAPAGVNAAAAWQRPGGAGDGVHLVDLEQGWGLAVNHEDLPLARMALVSGQDKQFWGHGTAVMGIIAAVDNDRGVVGIAPRTGRISLVSLWRTNSDYKPYDALWDAINRTAAGDVILLEAQAHTFLPIDYYDNMYWLIRQAVAGQRIVVMAAGNGAQNLNTAVDELGRQRWNVAGSASEAIMVGAAEFVNGQYTPRQATNRGPRVDCFAHGVGVMTTAAYTNNLALRNGYTNQFDGTSAAAAIVAGTAVALQGIARATSGQPFSPARMRQLLRLGTSSQNNLIGIMPDLQRIVASLP